jgi:uncharacterized protein YmfQ (DUF2313 family)
MGIDAAGYLSHLQALLPTGAAFTREPDAALTRLLTALAAELCRVDARGDDLIAEADPRTAVELLTDWERITGLPDTCMGQPDTVAARRAFILSRLTGIGGQSRAYFIDLAAAIGFTVTIAEFRPFTAGSLAGDPVTNGEWIFAWQVNAPETTVLYHFFAGSSAGEALRSWGNELLECVIERLKPAHTHLIFTYGG